MDLKNYHSYYSKHIAQYRIRKLVKKHVAENNPDSLTKKSQLAAKGSSLITQLLWWAIALSCVLTCIVHVENRISYYETIPKAVDVYLNVKDVAHMPALVLIAFYTKEFDEFITNFSVKGGFKKDIRCGVMLDRYLEYDGSDVKTLWQSLDTASIIQNASITGTGETEAMRIEPVNYVLGLGSKVYSTKSVKFGDARVKLVVNLNHPEVKEQFCKFRFMVVSPTLMEERINSVDFNLWLINPYIQTALTLSLRQYLLLNDTKKICVSSDDRYICEMNCYQEYLPKINCRFPIDRRENLPYCNTSNDVKDEFEKTQVKLSRVKPSTDCGCARVCDSVIISSHADADFTAITGVVEMYVRDSYVRIMIERNAYTLISLLCDIGGILGLYLGLSCLNITEIIIVYFPRWIITKRTPSHVHDNLSAKVEKVMSNVTKTHSKYSRRQVFFGETTRPVTNDLFINKHLPRIIWFLTVIICVYQTYNRFAYYLARPLTVVIDLREDEIVQLPSVVMCTDSPKIMFTKKNFVKKKKLNATCLRGDDFDFLDLLDPPSKFSGNPIKLWEETNTFNKQIFFEEAKGLLKSLKIVTAQFGNHSAFSTVYGNCTKATLGAQTFDRRSGNLWTACAQIVPEDELANCNCNVKHFLIPPGDEFDLKKVMYHTCNKIITILYSVQTLLRINTASSPCSPPADAIKCEKQCVDAKVMERNITCKLPFMASISLPLCNDSISAKKTRREYFEGHLKTNPLIDCGCLRRCSETVFLPIVSYVNEFPNHVTVVTYNVETNIREIITQKLAFPVEKLLCDVGSTLGILLGTSLLSIFKDIGSFLSKFKNYLVTTCKI